MNRPLKILLVSVVIIFAGIGLLFSAVFVAMQFGLLNVRGSILERNQFFTGTPSTEGAASVAVAVAVRTPCVTNGLSSCPWNETPEWAVVAGGLEKDAAIIARVARETGVDARLIAASVIPEQIRFFTSEREVFKRYFEPLKILGSLSQFSLGVSGIKQDTATLVEQHANNPSSPFYPGDGFATLIAYPADTKDRAGALYRRLTDEKDHYYSYLYTALYLKQIEMQWGRAGFPVTDDPYALVTLFNIGFTNSDPKANPQAGGAPITVGGRTYAFGELGGDFYTSNELEAILPR